MNVNTDKPHESNPACPPVVTWPEVARMRQWSAHSDQDCWKTIKKCPHCGRLVETIEKQTA